MKVPKTFGVAATLLMISSLAQADLSANIGWASEYHYRGIFQKTSSASAGLDYETGGFYAGTWAADVDNGLGADGLEIDGYFGYNFGLGELGLGVGYTGYFYTGDFDDTYQEINLSAGYGIALVEVAIGEYENFDGPTNDYTYYALTLEKNGFYGKYGGFSQDFDGEYFEFGYATTVADIDLGFLLLLSNESLIGDDDQSLIFTIGKTFDLN
jgi:uncharacterized protein (TIGR02001 family)